MSSLVRLAPATTVASLLFAATAAVAAPTVVALSGTTAPGGGNYSAFTSPSINAAGQVTFLAGLGGGTTNANLFTGTPGAVQAVALQSTAAPAGGNFNLINSTTATPAADGSGRVAFSSTLTGGSATGGVFFGAPGALQTVALQGTAAPTGGNYNTFTTPVVTNPAGQVAFTSGLTGGTSTSGIFVGTPGSLQTAAVLGGSAPGGGTFVTALTAPLLNNSGQVAFISLIGSSQGIFAGAPGSIQTVMLQGTAAPGAGGALYGTPATGFSYNNAGQVAFSASLTGGTSTGGVFAGAPGSVGAVALRGTAAPAGGNYGAFSGVSMSGAGKAVFTSALTDGTSTAGIFIGTPGSVQIVALQGTPTPVANTTFGSFASSAVPNALGQVAFAATLAGTGVDTTNDSALFAGAPGSLTLLVREGDVIDVDPTAGTDLRTVSGSINLLVGSGGQDGKGSAFSDGGIVAYRLSFTDGSSGVFTSVVPEPTSLGLLAAAGLLLRRSARRK